MTVGAGVEVRLLGPLEVLVDGRPVAVPGGKPRVALAVLALRVGQPVSVDTLADRLWGTEPPENIRGSLQTSMVRLRRALDGGPAASCLETVRGGYRLAIDPDRVDLARFRRLAAGAARLDDPAAARDGLAAALALWRGEPLTGVDSAVLRRDELPGLIEEWLSAVERRVDLDLALGHLPELVPELRELCGRYPLRESLWARLITALARLGRGAEAVGTYHVMRTGLAEELGVDPSAALREQYRRLLGGEPEPAPAAEPARPRQVPADVAHFTGRRAELAALDRLVEGGPAGVAVLDGAAGVGKTALAVHWAYRAQHRFPDGQLHLNLRGYGPGEPVRPEAALSAFLRALGAGPGQIPDGLAERAAAFRSRVADRRLLVLLDNARDAGQVRPLLPGGASLALVTSRNQLRGLAAVDGAHRVTVDQLTAADARDLVAGGITASRADAEPAAVAELVELCARLPLALRITAERVSRLPGLRLADLAAELRGERHRLDALHDEDDQDNDLRALLSWSDQALDADSARLFRLLGVQPGQDISLPATAALLDVPEPAAGRLLDRLVAVHLLEQHSPGRYEFHDLLRDYAAERADRDVPATDREAAVGRLIDWYVHTAYQGHGRVQPTVVPEFALPPSPVTPLPFDTDVAALAWYDAELANLVAVGRYALARGDDGTVIRLHRGMRGYLMHRCCEDEWTATAAMALDAARRAGDRAAEAFAVDSVGTLHACRFEFARALPHFERGLAILGADAGGAQWARTVNNVGLAQMFTGRLDDAVSRFERVLASGWAEDTSVLLNLGGAYGMQGRYADALAVSTRAAELYERHGVRRLQAAALRNTAEAHLYLGDHQAALAAGRRSLGLVRDLGDRTGEADTSILLGRILRGAGRPVQAHAVLRHALALLAAAGDRDSELVHQARTELATLPARTV